MIGLQSNLSRYIAVAGGSAVIGFLVAWPVFATGQDKKDQSTDSSKTVMAVDASKDLAEQIKQLQAKVIRLEAAVAKTSPAGGMSMPAGGKSGMGMMDDMLGMGGKKMGGGMAMPDDKMGGMAGGSGGMGMMHDDMDMMGMMGMGSMGGSKGKKMKMAAALPGFPGASHLYHIGATDFFLDHPEHVTLSTEQKTKLGQMKQKATTDKATAQRKIEEAEQQLWELTGADQPDAAKLEAKVREVEKLRGDQRLAFIRSVGESAQVLTDDQRKILIGQAQPMTPAPHVHPKTP